LGWLAYYLLPRERRIVLLSDCPWEGADLRITAGSGDDTVQLTGTTTVGGLQLIHLGGGINQGP